MALRSVIRLALVMTIYVVLTSLEQRHPECKFRGVFIRL